MLKDPAQTAADLNTVARFLAAPDVLDLTAPVQQDDGRTSPVDLLILLGNSVLCTMDSAAEAYRSGAAKAIMVVGGNGHSTAHLRAAVRADPRNDGIPVEGRAEAEILQDLLVRWHDFEAASILTETQSTNCGANAERARKVIEGRQMRPSEVLLVQDPTLQLRTWASFRRVWGDGEGPQFYNGPTFVPVVRPDEGGLAFKNPDRAGLWTMDRFVSLVMGEIPRLRNDENGYGPAGRGYIVAVSIPPEVEATHDRLLGPFGDAVRRLE